MLLLYRSTMLANGNKCAKSCTDMAASLLIFMERALTAQREDELADGADMSLLADDPLYRING